MNSVNLLPIDIQENTFETENNVAFDPSKPDIYCPEKEIVTEAVVKMLKKVTDLSVSNLINIADGLLSRKLADGDVESVGKKKQRLPNNKYKISH